MRGEGREQSSPQKVRQTWSAACLSSLSASGIARISLSCFASASCKSDEGGRRKNGGRKGGRTMEKWRERKRWETEEEEKSEDSHTNVSTRGSGPDLRVSISFDLREEPCAVLLVHALHHL